MNAHTINALEIVMVILYTLSRLSASAAVVYFLCNADITNGWKVFLIALAIIVGLGFNVKYENPNAQCDECALKGQDSVNILGTK